MPELAEVEHSRRKWDPGIGATVKQVIVRRPDGRVYRDTDVQALQKSLRGSRLLGSEARGKQMLFRFSDDLWIGIHLGMSGGIRCESDAAGERDHRKHDYFILRMSNGVVLVFEDLRLFGRCASIKAKQHRIGGASSPHRSPPRRSRCKSWPISLCGARVRRSKRCS